MEPIPTTPTTSDDPHLVAKTLIKLNPDWQVWYRHPTNSRWWFKTNSPLWQTHAEYLVLPPDSPNPTWRKHVP